MDIVSVLRRYQTFDPQRGDFGAQRSMRQYAALLGTSAATLSRCYSGDQGVSLDLVQALMRVFPTAELEITQALRQPAEVA